MVNSVVARETARRAATKASVASSRLIDPLRRTPPMSALGEYELLDERVFAGWVEAAVAGAEADVGVYLNSLEIVRLPLIADDRVPSRRRFRFRIRPLMQYARRTDRVTVRYQGRTLPFRDPSGARTAFFRPPEDGPSPTIALRHRLARGAIFNSDGQLRRPLDADATWQAGVLGLYAKVRAVLRTSHAYDAFLVYGSLLGAVREGNFIRHDTDLDAGYVSAHRNGPAAAAELVDVAAALVDNGLRVECRTIALHIYDPADPETHIDLFHTFFDQDGVLRFPWGVAGSVDYRREQWHGAEEIDFAGTRVLVPSDPEAMVRTIYGDGWRQPDPGFSWARDRTQRASSGRVPTKANSAANWRSHYAYAPHQEASTFAATCLRIDRLPEGVVDLGCGDGRDSHSFSEHGHDVIGLDLAPTAIRRAKRRATRRTSSADRRDQVVSFEVADVDDADALRRAVSAARSAGRSVLIYGHRLLDAVFEDTAATLLGRLAELSRPGDVVALASATEQPEDDPLRHRRAVDTAAVERELAGAGFTTLRSTLADGGPDGPVHELIMRRAPRAGEAVG